MKPVDRWEPSDALRAVAQPVGEEILLLPAFLDASLSDEFYGRLLAEPIEWAQEHLRMFGRRVATPRLTAWMADPDVTYTYSGITHSGCGMGGAAEELRTLVSARLAKTFNFVLLNRYRDGADSMGWHADDETELGPHPVIASLSLGSSRRFKLRRRDRGAAKDIDLPGGSLLIMYGASQRCWHHCVPKTARSVGQRINLTFRWVVDP